MCLCLKSQNTLEHQDLLACRALVSSSCMVVAFCLKLPQTVEMHITSCKLAGGGKGGCPKGGLSEDASRVLVLHCRCETCEVPEADLAAH